ncbi:hypothetical protein [Anaerotignum sp. MB30-C6]|uniref:hypothetical protein n=1 Tax=Anaerotignum sp. MB30-C6 TaxID=3070814 RepID=UPI0027DDDAD1|nr:hypothetical protein [Anaerotignum sp. MB30-C6]WMI81824.1 hypothetical protein RBQ60_03605 [Anaerotignum sp. MB30-C6]
MNKYIDTDIAEKSLRKYAEQKHANGEIELANGILKAVCKLRTLPSADAKEVVRGKWEKSVFAGDFHKCSKCEGVWNRKFDFCPYCGADMREVE